MIKKIGITLILIMFIISIGCTANTSSISNTNVISKTTPSVLQFDQVNGMFDGSVTVIHYDNYNVTCFVMDNYNGGGISCLSDLYVKGV